MELRKALLDEKVLLALLLIIYVLTYSFSYPEHAFQNDENRYIRLGYEMLEGRYSVGIIDRAPVLPFMVSASLAAGLSAEQIRFILPLFIGMAFLLSAYLLSKKLTGKPLLSVAIILTFPFFWQWQPFLLVDTLLGVFSSLSCLFFYRSVSEDKKNLYPTSLFLSLALLTKVSAVILVPAFFIYLLYKRKLAILKSREFMIAAAFGIIIVAAAAFSIRGLSGSFGENIRFMSAEKFFREPYYYPVFFAMVPWSLAFLYGLYKTARKRTEGSVLSLITFLTVFAFFSTLVWKEMRFLIFILPFYAIVAQQGLEALGKRARYLVLGLFLAIGASQSGLILDGISSITWGADIMSAELMKLEPGSLVYMDTIFIFHPSLDKRVIGIPPEMTYEEVASAGPDYIVLSLYGEIARGADTKYYKPTLGPFRVPFEMGSPKTVLDWWPVLPFETDLYRKVSAGYSLYNTISRDGQDIFLIFKRK